MLLGNLLVIPIQDSLLYVEPLFIRAENGQLPELQRLVASYSDRVVMGDTLDLTMAALFTNQGPPSPVIAKAVANEKARRSRLRRLGPQDRARAACRVPRSITIARWMRYAPAIGRRLAPR